MRQPLLPLSSLSSTTPHYHIFQSSNWQRAGWYLCVCLYNAERSNLLAELKMCSELPLDLFWEGDSTQQEVLLSFWGWRQRKETDRKWTYKRVYFTVAATDQFWFNFSLFFFFFFIYEGISPARLCAIKRACAFNGEISEKSKRSHAFSFSGFTSSLQVMERWCTVVWSGVFSPFSKDISSHNARGLGIQLHRMIIITLMRACAARLAQQMSVIYVSTSLCFYKCI